MAEIHKKQMKQLIKRILREETKKDLSPILKNLLNKLLVKHNKDILCGVEVEQSIDGESYEVTFTFIVHRGKVSFYAKEKHDSIMNEAWDLVYDFTNQTIEMKSKYVRTCNE